MCHRIIVPCIAYDCEKTKFRSFCSDTIIEEFWKAKHNKKSVTKNIESRKAPEGTWIAKSIMCLE
jgi:hypothetical protein